MGPFRKPVVELPKRRSMIASAARYTFGGAQAWKGTLPAGDRRWQIEAWRHYDMCGELRYATGWKGNACAQAIMYAADIDPETGQLTGPTTNQTIRDIAGAVLGGPVKRPQNIRTIVLNLEMAGEAYVVVVAETRKGHGDKWLVVSGTELYQSSGADIEYTSPDTGERVRLGAKDTLIRIWNGHPRLQLAADSAVRALLPTLREIEKSSQNIAARLDSRLIGAGLLISPTEADFPTEDDSEPEEDYSLSKLLYKNAQASLADPGSAASQVPIIAEVPAEFADGFRHITFETPLSKEVIQLRDSAIARLAGGLDLPREVLEGMGDSNHWSAWQVAEETYRTHLVPVLDVITDALTVAYLHPIATAAKVPDVDQYMLAFDGSALIGEPDPLTQVLELLDRGLITLEAALRMLHIPEDYAPTDDEQLKALALRLVTGAPTLFEQPVLRRILGFGDPEVPAAPAAPVVPAVAASGAPALPVDMASLAVLHALERAGNRLVSTQRFKSEFADVPRYEMHVRLKPFPERHAGLLEGAWRLVPEFAAEWDLEGYARALIAAGVPHTREALTEWMASRGE